MRDLNGALRRLPHRDRLGHRFVDRRALVAHVRRIDAARRARDLRELDDLRGLGVGPRDVLQSGREPHRARAHRVADQPPHLLQLRRRRRPPLASHDRGADAVVADQRRVVDGHLRRANLRERRTDIDRRSAAVAGDDRRHAHPDEIFGERPIGHFVGVRVNVDEAGRDDHPLDVEHFHALDGGDLADLCNLAVADENVAR